MLCSCPLDSLPAITEALFMRLETKTEKQGGLSMWLGQGQGRAWLSGPLFSRASEMPGFKSSRAAPEGRWAGGSAGRGSEEDRNTQAGGWRLPRTLAGVTPRGRKQQTKKMLDEHRHLQVESEWGQDKGRLTQQMWESLWKRAEGSPLTPKSKGEESAQPQAEEEPCKKCTWAVGNGAQTQPASRWKLAEPRRARGCAAGSPVCL